MNGQRRYGSAETQGQPPTPAHPNAELTTTPAVPTPGRHAPPTTVPTPGTRRVSASVGVLSATSRPQNIPARSVIVPDQRMSPSTWRRLPTTDTTPHHASSETHVSLPRCGLVVDSALGIDDHALSRTERSTPSPTSQRSRHDRPLAPSVRLSRHHVNHLRSLSGIETSKSWRVPQSIDSQRENGRAELPRHQLRCESNSSAPARVSEGVLVLAARAEISSRRAL